MLFDRQTPSPMNRQPDPAGVFGPMFTVSEPVLFVSNEWDYA